MFFTNVRRVIRAGFFSFLRNGFVSFSSIFVMIVTLCVISLVIFSGAVLDATLAELRDRVDLNVYFVTGAQESDILSIQKTLESLPEVERVTYTSQDEALADFKERHADDQFTLQALEELGENPLGAVLNVKTKEPSQYEGVANFLQGDTILSAAGTPIVDKVNYFQNKRAIDNLSSIINSADRIGYITALIFIIASILITFNTIRLVIYNSREEISVMRLVGASTFYVRGPFVVAGMIYGSIAGLITIIILYPITFWFGDLTQSFFIGINLFHYYTSNFGQLFLTILGSGIAIGAISSYLAVRKYLRI